MPELFKQVMKQVVNRLIKVGSLRFAMLFLVVAVLVSMMIVSTIDFLWDGRFNAELEFAGVITPLIDAFFLVLFVIAMLDHIRSEVAQRKQAEEDVRRYLNTVQTIMVALDTQGQITMINRAGCELLGYEESELLGRNWFETCLPQSAESDNVFSVFQRILAGEQPLVEYYDSLVVCRDNRHRLIGWHNTVLFDDAGHIAGTLSSGKDITESKQAEIALDRANRTLKTLSASNLALVRATNEDELLRAITNITVKQGGYNMAEVYYAGHDPEKNLMLMAWSVLDDSDYVARCLDWADLKNSQLPIAQAIRSGTSQICHDIASDPGFAPWKDAVLARGYVANIALPLVDGGRTFGALSIYSSEQAAFDAEEVLLLEELANDLAYGIITLRTRAEHEQHATILRQSLEQSIQTIAGTVEARDPSTAGHQRRVADLATAIAREMGLPDEQITGIHFAAIIHDLGKVQIPAEILAKPAKLSNIEFMLIQTHPQAGYEILKDVKFPWPIADIILQHHEKLDGSGYPQGLKGAQILLEAKIITVADVVEAISSHRPYRPSLGIEAAFEELKRNRGIQYDAQVVDACLKLFQEYDYKLPS